MKDKIITFLLTLVALFVIITFAAYVSPAKAEDMPHYEIKRQTTGLCLGAVMLQTDYDQDTIDNISTRLSVWTGVPVQDIVAESMFVTGLAMVASVEGDETLLNHLMNPDLIFQCAKLNKMDWSKATLD